MTNLLIIDESLKDTLLANGGRVLDKQVDVNGNFIWTMSVDILTFNINNDAYIGKFCVSNNLKLNF